MPKPWKLIRVVQCAKCPWRKSTNPRDIPNGYSEEKHKALAKTIAAPADLSNVFTTEVHVMACHEDEDAFCVGWLKNQIGPGNNIALRIRMRNCENLRDVRTIGEQHETFEDTLPQ